MITLRNIWNKSLLILGNLLWNKTSLRVYARKCIDRSTMVCKLSLIKGPMGLETRCCKVSGLHKSSLNHSQSSLLPNSINLSRSSSRISNRNGWLEDRFKLKEPSRFSSLYINALSTHLLTQMTWLQTTNSPESTRKRQLTSTKTIPQNPKMKSHPTPTQQFSHSFKMDLTISKMKQP